MAQTPEPTEFEGVSAFTVNVYIEYLDTATGEAEEILPDGGMVYLTDSAAAASVVADYLIGVAAHLPAIDESAIDEDSFESLLESDT